MLMATTSCVVRRPARLGGYVVEAGEGADGACACNMRTGLARAVAGLTEAAPHA